MLLRSVCRPPVASAVVAATLAAVLAACASGSQSRVPLADPNAGVITTTRIDGGGYGPSELRTLNTGVSTAEAPVGAAPAKVFSMLPGVYEALGVPVNTVMSDAGTFGARDARMPRRLGKTSLSQYVDCGANAAGAPNADTYAVVMTVLTRVTPATSGGGSLIATQVVANARPVTVAGHNVACSSTGRLEEEINRRVASDAAR
jgi:hypothetical protein